MVSLLPGDDGHQIMNPPYIPYLSVYMYIILYIYTNIIYISNEIIKKLLVRAL